MTGQGFKLREGGFRPDIKEKVFLRMVKHRHRLPREVVGVPSLEIFKAKLEGGSEQPDAAEGVPAHCRGVGLDGL